MFIELVSGVKYPKITTVGFVLKRPFVDVSSLCRSFFLFFFSCFFSGIFLMFFVSGIFCFHFERNLFPLLFFQLHVNWWAGLNFKALCLEFLTALWTWYLTLLSHIYYPPISVHGMFTQPFRSRIDIQMIQLSFLVSRFSRITYHLQVSFALNFPIPTNQAQAHRAVRDMYSCDGNQFCFLPATLHFVADLDFSCNHQSISPLYGFPQQHFRSDMELNPAFQTPGCSKTRAKFWFPFQDFIGTFIFRFAKITAWSSKWSSSFAPSILPSAFTGTHQPTGTLCHLFCILPCAKIAAFWR